MRIIFLIFFLIINTVFSQTCVFDGKKMNSLGLSEVVKKEILSLYRCSDGHQMWLTKEEEKNNPDLLVKENIRVNIDKTIEKFSSPSISTEEKELTVVNKVKDSEDISAVTKTETMLKKDSFELNYSNSLNIKKFGLETLLHKKMESDRQFIKELEDEKSELLHMMYTQKQLFERVDRSKFSLKKINIFKNNKVLSISLSILLASYLVN
mgnify:CR=1 FL=1